MEKHSKHRQPWLHSALIDGIFILAPPFIALFVVACFPQQFQTTSVIPVYWWLILVVFIDVAHVYSTLYRTYFKAGIYSHRSLLIIIPAVCYVTGVLLHSYDSILFWRILAYLAIFHFIRQQYGFMRLYSRKEMAGYWFRLTDKLAIYTATVYPLFYWHFDGSRNFSWFVENDVITYHSSFMLHAGTVIYLVIIALYVCKELISWLTTKYFNAPRNLLIAGTFISWYFGIVYFNGDLAFTTLNVISHGIPYMALIWIMEKRSFQKEQHKARPVVSHTFNKRNGIILFVALLVLLAYVEEGLWDGMIWQEHVRIFALFSRLPKINNEQVLSFLVPLLALPQSTHYVLDGFIWKTKDSTLPQ